MKNRVNEKYNLTFFEDAVKEDSALFTGINAYYVNVVKDSFALPVYSETNVLQIYYCQTGRINLTINHDQHVFLSKGDFCLRLEKSKADTVLLKTDTGFEGIIFFVDLKKLSQNKNELFCDYSVVENIVKENFFDNDGALFFAGNEQTEKIFYGFYNQPSQLKLDYQKIKFIELLLYVSKTQTSKNVQSSKCQENQVTLIKEIHDWLLLNLSQRITIEEIAKKFFINATTLKNLFKSVYGTSIATHINEHRMEKATILLKTSNMSISEISKAIGYDSQSKFTKTFKQTFGILPREYKKSYE